MYFDNGKVYRMGVEIERMIVMSWLWWGCTASITLGQGRELKKQSSSILTATKLC
jgi:hypothetical protein